MRRFESNGVKRGHAFGDIGDSLGGRAKLRLATITTWGLGSKTLVERQDLFWNRDKLVNLRFGKRGGQPLTLEEYFSEYSQVFGGHALLVSMEVKTVNVWGRFPCK